MSILRNGPVALSNLRVKGPMLGLTQSNIVTAALICDGQMNLDILVMCDFGNSAQEIHFIVIYEGI